MKKEQQSINNEVMKEEDCPINDTIIEKEPESTPIRILLSHLPDTLEILKAIVMNDTDDKVLKQCIEDISDLYSCNTLSIDEAEILIEEITQKIQFKTIQIIPNNPIIQPDPSKPYTTTPSKPYTTTPSSPYTPIDPYPWWTITSTTGQKVNYTTD